MAYNTLDTSVCYLCGQPIDTNAQTPEDKLSMDHVPPKQFFPKELRSNQNLNLRLAPTHGRCNWNYREDEEYFYHAMYAAVQKNNPPMGKTIFRDIARRIYKPQTPAILRTILKNFTGITEGVIHLPQGIMQLRIDPYRSQRIVLKIARGLFYLDHNHHLPLENCKDVRLCIEEDDVPKLYSLSWQGGAEQTVCPEVFSYRHFNFEGLHLWSMLFWRSFMFCTAFEVA